MKLIKPKISQLEFIMNMWADQPTMKPVGGVVLLNEDEALDWFRRMVDPGSPADCYRIIINDEEVPVGEVSFHRLNPDTMTAELNVKVLDRYRGRGYGSSAVMMMLDYFFGEFGGKTIIDLVAPDNTGGQQMLVSLGFSKDTNRTDVCLLSLNREDYENRVRYSAQISSSCRSLE